MKGRLYANWLVIITLFLFFSSLSIFVIYIGDTIGINQCAYGDDLGSNCICGKDGEKICDDGKDESVNSSEFTSSGLNYQFDFLNFVDIDNPALSNAKFVDISYENSELSITLEQSSMCSEDSIVSPQIGFYKLDKGLLTLTSVSNLTNSAFNLPCISENVYTIKNFDIANTSNDFRIQYQDEYSVTYPSNNCVYEGYIRNEGDVYNSADGCFLCHCKNGQNSCEKENSCLK